MSDMAHEGNTARGLEESLRNRLEDAGVEPPEEGKDEQELEAERREARIEFSEGLANLSPTQPKGILEKGLEEASEEEPVAEVETQQETEAVSELPNLDPSLPEDLAEELEMPDWEEDEEEVEVEEEKDDLEDEYADDPRYQELQARLARAEKKAQWAEQKRAEANRKKWEAEAKKYFPLSEYALSDIQSTSRRGFLREAKKAHEIVKPQVQAFITRLNESKQAAVDAAVAEALEEAKRAWGRPTVGPGGRESTTAADKEEKIRNAKGLEDRLKARIFG